MSAHCQKCVHTTLSAQKATYVQTINVSAGYVMKMKSAINMACFATSQVKIAENVVKDVLQ